MNRLYAGLALLLPLAAHAADFSTSFEGENQRTAGEFTITDGTLSATFDGGTAFTIGNGALYRSGLVSWMLDPEGTSTRGTSSGEGTVELSEDASSVLGYVRTENSQAVARLQVLDATGAVVAEATAGSADWTQLAHEIMAGEAPIASLRFINDGGGMAALDDFSFATDAANSGGNGGGGDSGGGDGGTDGGSSAGGSGALGPMILILAGLRRRRQLHPMPASWRRTGFSGRRTGSTSAAAATVVLKIKPGMP